MTKNHRLINVIVILTAILFMGFTHQKPSINTKSTAFTFAGVQYFHRFTKDDQNEYTPMGEEDLQRWNNMVTINYYRASKTGEALASNANAVLGNYKAAQARLALAPGTVADEAVDRVFTGAPRQRTDDKCHSRSRLHGLLTPAV
mgnify:CR=1 FL=1